MVEFTQATPRTFAEIVGRYTSKGRLDPISIDDALGIPAVWAAVNFLADALAGLPVHVVERQSDGRAKPVTGPVARLIAGAPNDEMSRFELLKLFTTNILTAGRGFLWIERRGGQPVNLWPLDPECVSLSRREGRMVYAFQAKGERRREYAANEIIDVPFQLRFNGINHRSPIASCSDALQMARAATTYGAQFFNDGGVPPYVITGRFQSPQSMSAAAEDLGQAVRDAARDKRNALVLPEGLEIKAIGGDPEAAQLVELQQFAVTQVARVFGIQPVFLHDLTNGTYSNTEQQDLAFVKHTLRRWIRAFEGEFSLKLFGRGSRRAIEFNVDALLRGDFTTRMQGYQAAIQVGLYTPDEARALEGRGPVDGGNRAYIQGANVPLTAAGVLPGMQEGDDADADE